MSGPSGKTVASLLTPAGRGAVATIVAEGPQALDAVARWFFPANGKTIGTQLLNRILFGRWGHRQGEEIVVCRRGGEKLEINCHGGLAAAGGILADLEYAGCTIISWERWLGRSANDPIQAAAAIALAEAQTERTASILLDQHAGALRQAIERIESLLISGDNAAAEGALARLLSFAPLGLHLTRPWQVVLAGPPNVGKSSLINAVLGFTRSIVYDQPGTTRDVVAATTAIDGWPVELSDTAGLRDTADELEAAGVERAWERMRAADLVLLVSDSRTGEIDPPPGHAPSRILLVRNKCDLAPPKTSGVASSTTDAALETSALTGAGIDRLLAEISRSLVPAVPAISEAIPFSSEQVEGLRNAAARLANNDCARVLEALRQISY